RLQGLKTRQSDLFCYHTPRGKGKQNRKKGGRDRGRGGRFASAGLERRLHGQTKSEFNLGRALESKTPPSRKERDQDGAPGGSTTTGRLLQGFHEVGHGLGVVRGHAG